MSRYEWEKGEFVIPSAEWAGVKATVRDAVNKANADMHEAALKLHERLGPKLKGAKQMDWEPIARKEMDALNPVTGYYGMRRLTDDQCYDIVEAVIPSTWDAVKRTSTRRLKKPQKKDFPQHGNNVTRFDGPECSVTFDNASRTMTWQVHENNHAVDSARATALGKAVFAALGKVKWTRGTGGTILGNDEYNRDSGKDYEGGGGSYSKESFGPDMPKAQPARSGFGGFGFRRF